MHDKVFILTHLRILQSPYNFLFYFSFSCQEKNTIKEMSEELLGIISMHVFSKIIQSILGFPPGQFLT